LVETLEEQGVGVSTGEPVPSGLDLYAFVLGHDAMRDICDGLIVLDLRTDVARSHTGWVAYADLCLVGDVATRTFLVDDYGYEPERIFIIPDDEALASMMQQALDGTFSLVPSGGVPASELGETPVSKIGGLMGLAGQERGASVADREPPVIEIRDPAVDGEAIARQVRERAVGRTYGPDPADAGPERLRESHLEPRPVQGVNRVALRAGVAKFLAGGELREPDFVSQAPVIGPVIVAVRRFWNWMSTKWYLRPIIRQQTAVNLQAGYLISELVQWRELDAQRLGELEARVAELEQRLRDVDGP
jgi:hypothetical protein